MWRTVLVAYVALATARTTHGLFDPVVIDTEDALSEYAWLRRDASCATAGSDASQQDVPKLLHQMWWQGENHIPAHFHPSRTTWTAHHNAWEHKLWDEAAVEELVNSSYAWFAPVFYALPSKIQKADAARYMILHAMGGVYADLDVDAYRPLDELLASPALQLFEEPYPHWAAHGNVISNGLVIAPRGHPLLLRILRAIRPTAQVFASTGSHMLQAVLEKCHTESEKRDDKSIVSEEALECGCYVTVNATNFLPLHASMRSPKAFSRVGEHADAARDFIEALSKGKWPPPGTFTAQFYSNSWIDPDIGALWLDGLAAARAGDVDTAEKKLLAAIWSRWGNKWKYGNMPDPPQNDRAKPAYERSLHYEPTYPFAYYELGNIALEASGALEKGSKEYKAKLTEAEGHYAKAAEIRPSSLLFSNNLGVAQLNLGKPNDALPSFERVLKLHPMSFATIKGLDAVGGAHLNIGVAMHNLGRKEEAYSHWRSALYRGSYEYAVQAAQRFVAAEAKDYLPTSSELDFTFGETLARAGRTREAALRYAAAHKSAATDLVSGSGKGSAEAMRGQVKERMAGLAQVWNEGEGAVAPRSSPKPISLEDVQVTEASSDGSTRQTKMTPELLDQIKGMQNQ